MVRFRIVVGASFLAFAALLAATAGTIALVAEEAPAVATAPSKPSSRVEPGLLPPPSSSLATMEAPTLPTERVATPRSALSADPVKIVRALPVEAPVDLALSPVVPAAADETPTPVRTEAVAAEARPSRLAPATAAAAVAAAIGASVLLWPTLRQYSRIGHDQVFDNEVRERIFGIVKAEPGASAREVSRAAGVAWGTTMYHLDVLERMRMVASAKDGRFRRYFPAGAPAREQTAARRNPVTARVETVVKAAPGLAQKELADRVGMTPQALNWHLARLQKVQLVEKRRDGRAVRYYAP